MLIRTEKTAASGVRSHRPSFGWDSLTEAELRVVGLAAEGLTNREIAERLFVSRRTVATHLEHVFQKLGFSTRVTLAGEVARRFG
jgi:DNA-binding CsgD family transcriptional regulator